MTASELSYSPLSASTIRIQGRHFVDPNSRILQLRGVNLSGSSKVPSSPPSVDIPNPSLASYIDRPFPLLDAPNHWMRLKRWGLFYLRVTVTWEAIEHAAPGEYDEKFLSYLRDLLLSATEHGLVCYVCMHQDVWSRLSGGSGAPGWTLQYAGFDLSSTSSAGPLGKLDETGAAYVKGIKCRGEVLEGDRGLWPTGYTKLACATMNTLFWAGKTFAPSFYITNPLPRSLATYPAPSSPFRENEDKREQGEEIHIQDFLQGRYLAAFGRLIEALNGVEGVLGFEMMNEPHPGYIGMADLHNFNYNTDLHLGKFPSPIQSFSSGAGHPTPNVPIYTRTYPHPTRISSRTTLNPGGASCWLSPDAAATRRITPERRASGCPWEREGVWAWDRKARKAVVLKEGYFGSDPRTGKKVDFAEDFYLPFVKRWEETVRDSRGGKGKMMHVEGVPNEFCPEWPEGMRPKDLVFSPHWYDLNTLFNKTFGSMTVDVQGLSRGMFILKALYFGKGGVKKNYAKQIGTIVAKARERLGEVPLVIGETGIPIDMNAGQAFSSGDFAWQERMMDALISGLEASLVDFNLWNYNPANSDVLGDDWNSESFSWYSDGPILDRSRETQSQPRRPDGVITGSVEGTELDVGGRLLRQVVRPYALRTAGIPLSSSFDCDGPVYRFAFANAPDSDGTSDTGDLLFPQLNTKATEFYLPPSFFESPAALRITVSDGKFVLIEAAQRLIYTHADETPGHEHVVTVRLAKEASPASTWNQFSVGALVLSLLLALGVHLASRFV